MPPYCIDKDVIMKNYITLVTCLQAILEQVQRNVRYLWENGEPIFHNSSLDLQNEKRKDMHFPFTHREN